MQIIATDSGLRLDSFLAEQVPELTRSAIQKLMESGLSRKDAIKQTAKDLNLPKNVVYDAALK